MFGTRGQGGDVRQAANDKPQNIQDIRLTSPGQCDIVTLLWGSACGRQTKPLALLARLAGARWRCRFF
jgi:hypothetical protein